MVENLLFIAATEVHAGGGNPILELAGTFGVDLRILLFQVLNFCIVAFLLYRFAFKPILATIEERKTEIANGLNFAEDAKAKFADSEKQHAATLLKAQQEAQAIAAIARNNAKAFLDQQTQQASSKTEDMITKAKEAIELERKKMLTEVREEVTRLVVETTSKVLGKELSAADKSLYSKTAAEELSSVGS
jgi:F-type H+-transporting ATPase subunit b